MLCAGPQGASGAHVLSRQSGILVLQDMAMKHEGMPALPVE